VIIVAVSVVISAVCSLLLVGGKFIDDVDSSGLMDIEKLRSRYPKRFGPPQVSSGYPGHKVLQSSIGTTAEYCGGTFEHQHVLSWRIAKSQLGKQIS
jgi:hypothetical protein